MASDVLQIGRARHRRILILLNVGCAQYVRALIEKHVKELIPPSNVDEFLKQNKDKINSKGKLNYSEKNLLYPPISGCTDISKWDLTLLTMIFLNHCNPSSSSRLKKDIRMLRDRRNTLHHIASYTLSEEEYATHLEAIEAISERCLKIIDNKELTDEVNACLTDDHTLERLRELTNDLETGLSHLDSKDANQNDLLSKILKILKKLYPERNDGNIADIKLKLDVKNCEIGKEKYICQKVTEYMEAECWDIPDDIKQVLHRSMVKLFNQDVEIVSAEEKGIITTLRCPSVNAVISKASDDVTTDDSTLRNLDLGKDASYNQEGAIPKQKTRAFKDSTGHQDIVDMEEIHIGEEGKHRKTIGTRLTHTHTIPNNEMLLTLCKTEGRKSESVQIACLTIRLQILSCSKTFKDVWAAYRPEDTGKIVFVIIIEDGSSDCFDFPAPLDTFEVCFRELGSFHNEEQDVMSEKCFSEEERSNGAHILQTNSPHLMEMHSNINIISMSCIKSKDFEPNHANKEHKTCIVLYVHIKGLIPFLEEPFPSKIGTMHTVVREGAFKFHGSKVDYSDEGKLKSGQLVGRDIKFVKDENIPDSQLAGTVGAFVDIDSEKVGFITCAHAVLTSNDLNSIHEKKLVTIKKENVQYSGIYQVAQIKTTEQKPQVKENAYVGHIRKMIFKSGGNKEIGVEAALIEITESDKIPDSRNFHKDDTIAESDIKVLSKLPDDIAEYKLFKYGARTGLTYGKLSMEGCPTNKDGKTLYNQIEVFNDGNTIFSDFGDSGALVYIKIPENRKMEKGIYALGMLMGGSDDKSCHYITPIWEVLTALQLPPHIKLRTTTVKTKPEQHLAERMNRIEAQMVENNAKWSNEFENVNNTLNKIMAALNGKEETSKAD